MNDRERFVRTMHYQDVDRIPFWDFGFWTETLDAWYEQGLPRDVWLNTYFGMDRQHEHFPINLGMIPKFDEQVIEDRGISEIVIDSQGVKLERRKDGSSIPHFLEFPVKDRASWEQVKKRYDPSSPMRLPEYFDDAVRARKDRDYPLGISCGSIYGWARNLMGVEGISMAVYDDPGLVKDMMRHFADLAIAVITPVLEALPIDYATFWEDMAYNTGPLLSPKLFREMMVPEYRRITDVLHRHGVDVVYVDCDGRIDQLLPLWLEAGVNCMFPWEARCNEDPWEMRKKYGRDLLIIGGIDKMALIAGREAIDAEVARRKPLMDDGGYIPTVDHRVPPDVTLDNYKYYLEVLRKAIER
ncbi:MAG: uroporphyrinogen decarboxylase family protein [Anaerolineae bacterium]|jgi:uroporphyrinogen decarboxylase